MKAAKRKSVSAAQWFAVASAEGAFCGREYPKRGAVSEALAEAMNRPQVVDIWNATTRRFDQIWSDTGLPYNPKSHGGR